MSKKGVHARDADMVSIARPFLAVDKKGVGVGFIDEISLARVQNRLNFGS